MDKPVLLSSDEDTPEGVMLRGRWALGRAAKAWPIKGDWRRVWEGLLGLGAEELETRAGMAWRDHLILGLPVDLEVYIYMDIFLRNRVQSSRDSPRDHDC